jgi:negative regulator of sigma E activity
MTGRTRRRLPASQLLCVATSAATIAASLMLMVPSAQTQETPAAASAVLERMAGAEHATYQARQLVVYMGEPQSAAVLDVRSGLDGTFVRAEAGKDVRRLWLDRSHGVVSDQRAVLEDTSPPSVALSVPSVLRKYAVEVGAPAELLGVDVVPLALHRRKDRMLVERMWVHRASGVVYRRELFGSSGELVGMCTMLDMHWGSAPGAAAEVLDEPGRPDLVSTRSRTAAPARLPYGYTFVRGYRLGADGGRADHWVYTDGLHVLSVFRTAGSSSAPDGFRPLELDEREVYSGPGPGTWAWEGGGYSWVVVSEESALDPAELTARFPHGGPSVWARLGSVWARMWHAVVGLVD